MNTRDSSVYSSLPPGAVLFLDQIADPHSSHTKPSFKYASNVILPITNWPKDAFLQLLVEGLAQSHNALTLEQAQINMSRGDFSPFTVTLLSASKAPVTFFAFPRPIKKMQGQGGVTISLAAQPSLTQTLGPMPNLPIQENLIFRLLDILPAYVLLIDQNYTVRFANKVAKQLLGQSEGAKCHRLLRGLAAPCPNCSPFEVFTESSPKVNDWIHARSNSAFRAHSYSFLSADGSRYLLQVGINITAGIRAKNALDLSEQRYRTIADNLTMGLVLIDPGFNTLTLNPKMEEWLGNGALKGIPLDKLFAQFGEECGKEAERVLSSVVATQKNQEGEITLTLRTGEERHFRIIACPILARSNILRAMVVILEDITDSRHIAIRMQQMQRLEALGSLAGGIAHEINQPLSALHLYASGLLLLLESGADTTPGMVMERLALILSQADKIRQIVNHMRALVMQEENPPLDAVYIADAVRDALGLVGTQLSDHNIRVITEIPKDMPAVRANAMQLEQVVINLLVNAMHALDTATGVEKTIRITASADADNAVFHIQDNGPGLGTNTSRIFDPFFTTKEAHKGMGLGLSIVHAFITGWGGGITAGNNPDGPGAKISITLPTKQESA